MTYQLRILLRTLILPPACLLILGIVGDLSHPVAAQAIVILGGGGYRAYAPEYGGPAPAYELYDRLAYGAYVARHTGLPILVTGNGTEAVAMQVSLSRDFAVQAKWVDNAAEDTYDNAHDCARILRVAGVAGVVLVTSDTHLWQAGTMSFVPTAIGLLRSYDAVYELMGEGIRDLLVATHLRRTIR